MSQTTCNAFKVCSVSPDLIQVEVIDIAEFKKKCSGSVTIGSYLKISDDIGTSVIALLKGYKIKDPTSSTEEAAIESRVFILDTEPVGFLDANGNFKRGGHQLTIPPSNVELATTKDLEKIYSTTEKGKDFSFGTLIQDEKVRVKIDGDKFFSKHIGVVGSTGSGKSCTVAKLLQEGISPSAGQKKKGALNNSHILIFDLHDEYSSAFKTAKKLSVENIVLPCWLMNGEELQEIFIESNEQNSHNQISQFRQAVILNKKRHNPKVQKISFETPVYFNIREVYNYIFNLNSEFINQRENEKKLPKLKTGELIEKREDHYFEKILEFVPSSTSKESKSKSGPFAGDFDRFVMRLEGVLNDERLSFLLNSKIKGEECKTKHVEEIIRQFIGYTTKAESNVTILDLSGIPFEVLSLVVSLISRITFDFFLHYKPIKVKETEVPLLLVYEEAHNYASKSEESKYRAVKKSIERIAKEGRKYGLSLMIVSQRPSEISETIFSQCNNFIAMRLTNPTDQNYVNRLLPDVIKSVTDSLPTLEKQEALIIGDSISLPTITKVDSIVDRPASIDVDFYTEWRKNWVNLDFEKILKTMK